ncbi:Reverse transcriptase [Phytophthora palmivora]|uniref:Reverse transcriptase n=1 Tax=Phytophthora palmivora TaxID=4796 RepID=A0A2P4Y6B6_9STRA|nr:Reverse transcriptase [Phytophthora palmivora]
MTVFQRNIPAPSQMGPVMGRSSYIDDIAHGAPTWEQLCQDLNALLFRLRYWNISVSFPKSEFGKLSIPYLSHEISAEGIRAIPKIAKGVKDLPFPTTLKGVQSFMGSLNYYNKFIEDLPVIAAVLYELTEEQMKSRRDLSRAQEAFEILKHKIVSTPLLGHPDRSRPFVIIPHANPWAASAVLGQEYDGIVHPVRFTGRILNDAELRYHIAEKEVIAILRVLEVFRTLVEGSPKVVVYTRYSVLKWLLTSQSADGRSVKWGLKLSHWDLEIRRVQRDEDGLAAILGAGITPREHLDEVAENLIPAKRRVKPPEPISIEMLEADYEGYILSFDVHVKREFNQAADYLTSKTLALGESWKVEDADERTHLQLVSKIHEKLVKPKLLPDVGNQKDDPQGAETLSEPMGPLEYQAERWRRIKVHQDTDDRLLQLKDFLRGNTGKLSHAQARKLAKVADDFVPDSREILYRLSRSTRDRPRDMGGHQGITRTYEKLRSEFYWHGPSPGNGEPRRQFEVVSMDFVTHLPKSDRGNTFLLLFQDAFSGFVMCKPMSSTTAQDVAEVYEEQVFRRFGASSMLRHDQDPRFMSEVFTRFRELLGSKQRATLAYRPQANGLQERSVQTVVRSIRAYIAEAGDWDDHAERLMFALNTSFDATRLDTPFFLVHGWDAHGTVSAMLGPRPSSVQERTAYEWRRKLQRDYSYAQACAEDLQKKAKRVRSAEQTRKWKNCQND